MPCNGPRSLFALRSASRVRAAPALTIALLATAAFAQTPTATTDRANMAPAAASDTSSFQGTWRASKLVGLNVYNDKNESLGSINDLLTDKDGNIKAVVIGVGGLLVATCHRVAQTAETGLDRGGVVAVADGDLRNIAGLHRAGKRDRSGREA